jgi:hypothetical protein
MASSVNSSIPRRHVLGIFLVIGRVGDPKRDLGSRFFATPRELIHRLERGFGSFGEVSASAHALLRQVVAEGV